MRLRLLLIAALLIGACSSTQPDRIVLAAGTTIVDSGLVDRLVSDYLATTPAAEISVVGGSTAEILQLGANGAADVLITHQPKLEAAFLAEHPEAVTEPLFASGFLLVGPASQDILADGTDIIAAFAQLAAAEASFVSRADGSGTFAKEQQLWSLAAVEPEGAAWRIETGQGMGFTLQVADQRKGFTLTEEGAYLTATATLSLQPVATTSEPGLLDNPYRSIVVEANPGAVAFQQWLVSGEGRESLDQANRALYGRVVYRVLP